MHVCHVLGKPLIPVDWLLCHFLFVFMHLAGLQAYQISLSITRFFPFFYKCGIKSNFYAVFVWPVFGYLCFTRDCLFESMLVSVIFVTRSGFFASRTKRAIFVCCLRGCLCDWCVALAFLTTVIVLCFLMYIYLNFSFFLTVLRGLNNKMRGFLSSEKRTRPKA